MASDAPETAPEHVTVVRERPPLWARILKWLGIAIATLAVLVMLVLFGINTDPGRGALARFLSGYTLTNGLNIQVGRIEGSIYGAMTLRDVKVRDTKGVFAESPAIAVDWRPFAFLRNHVDVRSASSPLIRVLRLPALKPSLEPVPKNQPLLPNIDIDVNRLAVDRLELAQGVAGAAHIVKLAGSAHIADRRAQVNADALALTGPGIAGGDRLHLVLDAVPDDNRFNINAKLAAPVNGVVTGLAHLTKPLALSIDGRGDWKAWNGHLTSTLGGGSLADLALTARSGTFTVTGPAHPGLYLAGPVERLTAPQLDINARASLDKRVANTQFALRSSALAVDGQGIVDLGKSRLGGFQVDARLLTPGAIAPNLNGRDVAASVVLDGPFATPTVAYKINAAALGFGKMAAEGLIAHGVATVNSKHIMIPVDARVARISGLNAAAGGLLTHVALNGDIAITGPQILSDNLHVRSDKIDATAIIAANMQTGRYTGALKGRVNDYLVNGIGIVNVSTDAHLVTAPAGGFGIAGRVVAQTVKITNSGAAQFLGGNASMHVDVALDPKGIITFRNLRLGAPKFAITRGEGRYDPNGPIAIDADAVSKQYGPLYARVTGSLAAPQVLLRAPRPGLGVGLANVEARVQGRNGAYAVVARGGTKYGPFTADVLVRPSPALTVDIHRAHFAGVDITGRVAATEAGPFAGQLQFAGSGLNGRVGLSAQGRYQHADVAAQAHNFTVPGVSGFTIGRAIIAASATMVPNAPQVIADAQVADVKYGAAVLQAARVKVNEVNGTGTAQLVARGSASAPFDLAVNARLTPKMYVAALQGHASGIGFRTGSLLRVEHVAAGWHLLPTRIDFDHGSARIAGTYGKGMLAQLRLDRLDLSIANALVPNLGIGGQATGSLDFVQANAAAFPQADLRATITNFSRSSLASVSEPVDIVMAGGLQPSGATMRALIRRGPTAVGRLVANLAPAGGGSWSSRLMAGNLSGGIRYNGPAAVLFSFAGQGKQQLSGPIAVGADFSGRLNQPNINGLVRATSLTYDNEQYGTHLTNMALTGRFTMAQFVLDTLTARAGSGTVTAKGTVGLAAASGFPIDITAAFNNAQLAQSDALGATATGQLHITHNAQGGLIQGQLRIPNARYQIVRQNQAQVPELTGVRRKGQDVQPASATASAASGAFKLDLTVRAQNQLYVSGMGLESEWSANMHVGGTSAAPQVTGELEIVRGTYSFAGKEFEVSDQSRVTLSGAALSDPTLDIIATTDVNDITAEIDITGTGQHPNIAFTSTPALPQDEVLSRLLFGDSVTNLSATEALQLAAALNSLRGGGGGLNPLGKLRSATGLDRLRILGADDTTGRGTAVAAGKYITKNVYVEIVQDAQGFTATQLEISLTRALKLLSQASTFGGSNASVRYTKDY